MAVFVESATVTHGIQLAVAPVFLLTAVSGMIGAVAGRLSRIIDRGRVLEEKLRLDAEPVLAPQWNAEARGTIIGLTRDSRLDHIVRAGLEAVAYQTADLLEALRADGAPPIKSLLVDGGLTANNWAMQFLADIWLRDDES